MLVCPVRGCGAPLVREERRVIRSGIACSGYKGCDRAFAGVRALSVPRFERAAAPRKRARTALATFAGKD